MNNLAFDLKKPVMAPPIPPSVNGSNLCDENECKPIALKGHVGFNSLPQQLVAKAMSHGFDFNILCVGETGIGKTTMMESLFNMSLQFEPSSYELNKIELRTKTYDVQESGVCLKLTICETAGFGDQQDKESSASVIVNHINDQYEKYLQEELKVKRNLMFYRDTRIHACIYFISPTGHGLKALDVVTLKELSKRVNVIPVIAKADTTSKEELKRFKSKILSELKANNVEIYKLPEDDETIRKINAQLNSHVPFAVVGSNDFITKDGKKVRARSYPWGVVEVENEAHCDFVKLREALLRVNVEDLRERTHKVLYESYRRKKLQEMGLKDSEMGTQLGKTVSSRMQNLKETFQRQEQTMNDEFRKRVETKDNELKAIEEEIKRKYEEQLRRLEAQLNSVESEIKSFDDQMDFMKKRQEQRSATTNTKKQRR